MAAQVRPDIVVRIGSVPSDVQGSRVAIDAPHPFVQWDLPSDIQQARFAVRISNDEGSGAYATSGENFGNDDTFAFPTGVALGVNFEGRCKVEVAVSTSATPGANYEFISAPLYFAFDLNLEKFFNARHLMLSWQAPTNPDGLPAGVSRYFHLQLATDPLFTEIVYENTTIPDSNLPTVQFLVPADQLTLVPDKIYFYRVRANDGMDYGDWSKVNAFHNYSNLPPTVRITDVTHLHNDSGDVQITFDLEDANNDFSSVEITYSGAGLTGDPVPIRTLTPLLCLPPGTHKVVWRTMKQLSNKLFSDVVLYIKARDQANYGPDAAFGPFTLDNSYIADPGGGIGQDYFVFAVGGAAATHDYLDMNAEVEPVQGQVATEGDTFSDNRPVAGSKYAWREAYAITPLEPRQVDFNKSAGWGSSGENTWPNIILRDGPLAGIDKAASVQRHALVSKTAWMFRSPVDYAANADGWPKSYSSKLLLILSFLRGYLDMQGSVIEYPDFYDWANRPAWHAGREVWDTGDAWVQIGLVGVTEYKNCTTCNGRHWVVSPSGNGAHAPYSRVVCPNPTCVNGFDSTQLLFRQHQDGTQTTTCNSYTDVVWVRLSRLVNGGQLTPETLFGLRSGLGQLAGAYQHIVGRGLSSLEGNYTYSTDQDGNLVKTLVNFTQHLPDGDRILPVAPVTVPPTSPNPNLTVVTHPVSNTSNIVGLTRQVKDAPGMDIEVRVADTEQTMSPTVTPVAGAMATSTKVTPMVLPVQGEIAPGASDFITGVAPDGDMRYWWRPRPDQTEGLRVVGTLGRVWETKKTDFIFFPAYWDAYNTIHWQATGSETSTMRLQVRQVLGYGQYADWQDVQADNAYLDTKSQHWLVPPLSFHAYWNTANRTLFPSGGTYELQIQQYDPLRGLNGKWVVSPTFQIINGVTNPVSITGMSYEPWSKVITLDFRCDDSECDEYTLIGFAYSLDQGKTWQSINVGDIEGETTRLSSRPRDNEHTIYWQSSGYNLPACNEVRVKIDCVPADAASEIMVPVFKWLTPYNPFIDPADSQLVDILGRPERQIYNPETGLWDFYDPPRMVPGRLGLLRQEYVQVLDHGTGAYACMTQDTNGAVVGKVWNTTTGDNRWTITDTTGYGTWSAAAYTTTESHGQALARISNETDYIVSQQLPQLRKTVTDGEVRIRKNLMEQGLFAENLFDTDTSGNVVETITVQANGQEVDTGIRNVTRWWRFRVQSMAEGPNDQHEIYDAQGNYAPVDLCDLETVRYIWQMDATSTFDSQARGTPLRSETQNYDGSPLGVALNTSTAQSTPSSSPSTDANNQPNAPGQTTTISSDSSVAQVGGMIKLPPGKLPGNLAGDILAAGQTAFPGDYNWRVAAYNPVLAPVTARPRPLISSVTYDALNGLVKVSYLAQAPDALDTMTIDYTTDYYGGRHPIGYSVSRSFKATPTWDDATPMTWISDRRAAPDSPSRQINGMEWTAAGTHRRRLSVFWDADKQLYVGCVAKTSSDAWWIATLRGAQRNRLCEFDNPFTLPVYSMEDPALVKVGGTYHLWITIRQTSGGSPAVYHATSTDMNQWSDLLPTDLPACSQASVVWDATNRRFVAYVTLGVGSNGHKTIAWSTSADGACFAALTECLTGTGDVQEPAAILLNGHWVLYYRDGTRLRSVYGTTPGTLGNTVDEIVPASGHQAGTPTLFIDAYQGNPELFMCYDLTDLASNAIVQNIARLEDREWEPWQSGMETRIFAAPGNLLDVECNRDGNPCNFSIDAYTFGVQISDSIKVRLNFTHWTPLTRTYSRRSDWVDATNAAATSSVLEPLPFAFSDMLNAYPYMRAT